MSRIGWSREQIERHQLERLRGLLGWALGRSHFHAERLKGLDPSSMTVEDLARLPVMSKTDAQSAWDEIVTVPHLTRAEAERILAEQSWFSYTAHGEQVFSSGGSSGVRGVYVWDWHQMVTLACLAWRMQAREDRRTAGSGRARLAVLEAGAPPHASTPLFDVATSESMETLVIPAADPFEQVLAAVA